VAVILQREYDQFACVNRIIKLSEHDNFWEIAIVVTVATYLGRPSLASRVIYRK